MAKGLTIFKAFSGVGSVAVAGAGAVVAVKSGIFLKKEISPTTTPQLSSLMSNSLDGDKLAQPSESLDTGLFGDGGAGSFLDALSNPQLLTSLNGSGVLGPHDVGAGFDNPDLHAPQTALDLPSVTGLDDDDASPPDSSEDSGDDLSSGIPPIQSDPQPSSVDTVVSQPPLDASDGQQAASSDPTKSGDGAGDAVEADLDKVDKAATPQTTTAGEAASANSSEAVSAEGGEDGGTAPQTTHTDESETISDVSAPPSAPEGATAGVSEKGGDEGDKTSASNPTPDGGAIDALVSTADDGGETVAPDDSTSTDPVANQADSVGTNTPPAAVGGEAADKGTAGVGGEDGGGATTAAADEGEGGIVGGAEGISDSSRGTGTDTGVSSSEGGSTTVQTPSAGETHADEGQTTPAVPAEPNTPGVASGGESEVGDTTGTGSETDGSTQTQPKVEDKAIVELTALFNDLNIPEINASVQNLANGVASE